MKDSCDLILALGGGGARGLAHLGALEVIQDADLPIKRIVGVSIGSLLGALYALEGDIRPVQRTVMEYVGSAVFQAHQEALYGARSAPDERTLPGFSWFGRVMDYLRANRAFHRAILRKSLLPGRVLEDVVTHLLPDADIADTRIPLTIVTADLVKGRRVVLEHGPMREAVRGSSSLPGIFPPVDLDGKLLCDIGVFYAVPAKVARYYDPGTVVAIDVTADLGEYRGGTALETMMRMQDIGGSLLREETITSADIIIRPEVGAMEWMDFSNAEACIEIGREAARASPPEIPARVGRCLAEDTSPPSTP